MQQIRSNRLISFTLLLVLLLSLVACGGGVSDTTIPTPSGASPVNKGDDQMMDLFMETFESSMKSSLEAERGKIEKTGYYKTDASVSDVKNFYTTEMPKRGWKAVTLDNASEPGMEAVAYESGNDGAVILIMDMNQLMSTGTMIITMNAKK